MADVVMDSTGQSIISVLVAVFVIALVTTGVLGMSIVTTRLLVEAERGVAALAIANERKEYIESLPYHDVGFVTPGEGEPPGVIAGSSEPVSRNNQTYQLSTVIQYVDDLLTSEAEDYKKVEIRVGWSTAAGAARDVAVVTYVSEKGEPKSCASCPDPRGCDKTTGVCTPPDPLPSAPAGPPCTPGLLCANGTLCPLSGNCPDDGTAVPPVDPLGEACVPGRTCSNGALCPLSGVCPTASCPDWTCPGEGVCFNGFCYQADWYDITFSSEDSSGPASSSAMICEQDQCASSLDCPANCESDCQYIDTEAFTGCGRWQVVRQCQTTWVPSCQAAAAGGASSACRGGYDAGGGCADLECNPVACPPPDPLVDPDRSWCANSMECYISSSNTACADDSNCPSGEMCGVSGACRTICPDEAACNYYWGGWAKGCSVEVAAKGPSGCTEVGGSCTGPAGDCSLVEGLTLLTVDVVNVDTADYNLVLSNPLVVPEGGLADTTAVAFRVSVSQEVSDTVTVRVELRDGSATRLDGDYSGTDTTLTFEPGGSLSQVVLAGVIGDSKLEGDEDFRALLVRARSNAYNVQIGQATAAVTVANDDLVSSPPPVSPLPPAD